MIRNVLLGCGIVACLTAVVSASSSLGVDVAEMTAVSDDVGQQLYGGTGTCATHEHDKVKNGCNGDTPYCENDCDPKPYFKVNGGGGYTYCVGGVQPCVVCAGGAWNCCFWHCVDPCADPPPGQ